MFTVAVTKDDEIIWLDGDMAYCLYQYYGYTGYPMVHRYVMKIHNNERDFPQGGHHGDERICQLMDTSWWCAEEISSRDEAFIVLRWNQILNNPEPFFQYERSDTLYGNIKVSTS